MEWRVLAGQPYILARDAAGRSRLVTSSTAGELQIREHWADADIMQAAPQLLPYPVVGQQRMTKYDSYYYSRHPEAMNGAAERRLPASRLNFDDPSLTRVYIDLHTGDVAISLDPRQRTGRRLFNFLHSWATPGKIGRASCRESVCQYV